MTTGGLVMMIVSTVSITALTVYCFWRVLTLPNPSEVEHAPLDIDTRDVD